MKTLTRKPNTQTILKAFNDHEEKDVVWFKEQGKKLDDQRGTLNELLKRQKDYEELLVINGGQISHFQRQLLESASDRKVFQESMMTLANSHTTHLEELKIAVAPFVKAKADELIVNQKLASMGETIKKIAGVIIALSTVGGIVMYAFKKFL